MIFIDQNIPSDYRYIVDLQSNYIVLYNHSSISSINSPISVYIQFFTPSQYVYIPNYYLTNSSLILTELTTTYDLVDSSSTDIEYTTRLSQLDNDYISSDIFDRSDFPQIFICGFIILFLFAFILNNLSKLVKKGGIFGSN